MKAWTLLLNVLNPEFGRVDPSQTWVEVSLGDLNVFRRGVQARKTAFEGSMGRVPGSQNDVQGLRIDVDVLLKGSMST
jgi:hypothetical protein